MSRKTEAVTRRSVSMPDALWARIEEYRARQGAVTVADALRRLVVDALEADARKRRSERTA